LASEQDFPGGFGTKIPALENLQPSQKSGFDYTHKLAPRIGRQFVAVMKLGGIHREGSARIPDDQVGVAAGRDRSLPLGETCQSGG
jgi:hypothetical protein